jgi:hypothetical protein
VLRKQKGPQRGQVHRSTPTGKRGARLSYANVTASLALFIALGGTAAAAVTLPRDSVGARQIAKDAVGSPEIAKDAVRSPEIVKDAVRSPEIEAGAVRTSELEDKGIRLADISDGARNALQGAQGPAGPQGPAGTASVRFDEADSVTLSTCDTNLLTSCTNLASLPALPAGNWLVQAKLTLVGSEFGIGDQCGLVQGLFEEEVIDQATSLGLNVDSGSEQITLSDVVVSTEFTTIGVRCTEDADAFLTARDVKITALEVTDVLGI